MGTIFNFPGAGKPLPEKLPMTLYTGNTYVSGHVTEFIDFGQDRWIKIEAPVAGYWPDADGETQMPDMWFSLSNITAYSFSIFGSDDQGTL